MPSTISVAGLPFEMKPRAPAPTREFAKARSSEKLNTMIAPFEGSEARCSTRSRIRVASPYVSKSVTSTAPLRRRLDIELDHADPGRVRAKESAKSLEHDLVVVDERDTDLGT